MNHNRQTSLQTTHRWLRSLQVRPMQSTLINGRDSAHDWVWSWVHACVAIVAVLTDIRQSTNPAAIHGLCTMTTQHNVLLAQTCPTMMKQLPRFVLWYTMSLAFKIYWESRITIYDNFLARCIVSRKTDYVIETSLRYVGKLFVVVIGTPPYGTPLSGCRVLCGLKLRLYGTWRYMIIFAYLYDLWAYFSLP